ncbi:uncharacterized protein LOC111253451 isoform X4 [Varroa destructor]|uniref:Dumpy n=1 Tax=Varroa destructor TaxID=109461 RepID=A0A7M7KL29_VARDE|nr:uncharacterized protein LOC111253451 isoform X4 [Varroa destructor]
MGKSGMRPAPGLFTHIPCTSMGRWHTISTIVLSTIVITIIPKSNAYVRPGSLDSAGFPSTGQFGKKEIFFLNLEDGYFGCQVNASTEVLQLFDLSKLCDGESQCFQGSDENSIKLKCQDRNHCHPKMARCRNGACLDGLCYCNDGYGGKGCEMPDENECKYRPCDVFAHCTNTMGSFYCSCFPGYEGDGFECKDVNECDIPELRAICVENSECCNLPGHYVCKCLDGFTGNATEKCHDLDECHDPGACGHQASCRNAAGSYLCECPPGLTGDPYTACNDLDECEGAPLCGPNAICHNSIGSFSCSCLPGYRFADPNQPHKGCIDVDECASSGSSQGSICGVHAICHNTPGSFYCQCEVGYTGNPRLGCQDINECQHQIDNTCGQNTQCSNVPGSYRCECKPGCEGDPYSPKGCQDVNECTTNPSVCGPNSRCVNDFGSYHCVCAEGFEGDPAVGCTDIDECLQSTCAYGSLCYNLPGSFRCECPRGYTGDALQSCERDVVEVACQGDHKCTEHAHCVDGICQCRNGYQVASNGRDCVDRNECLSRGTCGRHAVCVNTEGAYLCQCKAGYEKVSPDPRAKCRDMDECAQSSFPCGLNSKCINTDGGFRCVCPDNLIGNPKEACISPCDAVQCGTHATCQANGREAACICDIGFTFNPSDIDAGCVDVNECGIEHGPSGLCGVGAFCTNVPGSFHCACPPGFTGNPFIQCEDIDECLLGGPYGACASGALCTNRVGSFSCHCPAGFTGNGHIKCSDINECSTAFGPNGKCGRNALCTNIPGNFSCQCPPGHTGNAYDGTGCALLSICSSRSDCPGHSDCRQGQCFCMAPNFGPECKNPCDLIFCGNHATCELDDNDGTMCVCSHGYTGHSNSLGGCVDIDECHAQEKACGPGAVCRNLPGSYECVCPHGASGDPYAGCLYKENQVVHACSPSKPQSCSLNEECVAIDGRNDCVCRRGFTFDVQLGRCRDINECTEFRQREPCGRNAFCQNLDGSYQCQCPAGYIGDPYDCCHPEALECRKDEDCVGNTVCLKTFRNETGRCGCHPPFQREGDYCVLLGQNCTTLTPCLENHECVFTTATTGYCICPKGYTLEANGKCRNINECTEVRGFNPCGPNSQCRDLVGSYQCLCAPGFTGNPKQGCSPIKMRCRGSNDCSPNKQCVESTCHCLPPFVADGDVCKDPCDWMQCGQFAICAVDARGQPTCSCKAGCSGDPYTGCADVNECTANLPLDPNGPCGSGATCINLVGSYKCECPPGTQGNPAIGCEGRSGDCRSDADCPATAVCDVKGGVCYDPCLIFHCGPNSSCEPEGHKATCWCLPGFEGDPYNQESGCRSPCVDVWCGVNAQCIVNSRNKGVCKCLPGYRGNPWEGGECTPDTECGAGKLCPHPGQECHDGWCVDRCENVRCGLNARCDRANGLCSCLPYFIGNSEVMCVPPVLPPICSPRCGAGAHCVYGVPNYCVCNPTLSGNPYSGCSETTTKRCSSRFCGTNAICSELGVLDCRCPAGLQGNPYTACTDVNECLGGSVSVCGTGAKCVNTFGSFKCVCPAGYIGNPLFACTAIVASPPGIGGVPGLPIGGISGPSSPPLPPPTGQRPPVQPSTIDQTPLPPIPPLQGRPSLPSPPSIPQLPQLPSPPLPQLPSIPALPGFLPGSGPRGGGASPTGPPAAAAPPVAQTPTTETLAQGAPIDDCESHDQCGHNELCVRRRCIRPCDSRQCGQNAYCIVEDDHALCKCESGFIGRSEDQQLRCSPAKAAICADVQCGPNAACEEHQKRPVCTCKSGFGGDANDLIRGCAAKAQDECHQDPDCREDHECKLGPKGVKQCRDVCEDKLCGPNANCLGEVHKAICECLPGFVFDGTGCHDVCLSQQCAPNARCQAVNHRATCVCRDAFFGNPNDAGRGCQPILDDFGCLHDADCSEAERCLPNAQGVRACVSTCAKTRCGPHALCIGREHRPECVCREGFAGNPADFSIGCQEIRLDTCNTNADCLPFQACKATPVGVRCCVDVCLDRRCGPNSNCFAEAHQANCECLPGFAGNPADQIRGCQRHLCENDGNCGEADTCALTRVGIRNCTDVCLDKRCGPNSDCVGIGHRASCVCRPGFEGIADDIREGCLPSPKCRTNSDCQGDEICAVDASGVRACLIGCATVLCGHNTHCRTENHITECRCHDNFVGDPYNRDTGCTPLPERCYTDHDCPSIATCKRGPDGKKDCFDACDGYRCAEEAVCTTIDHRPTCECRPGLVGDPFVRGCRIPDECERDTDCADDLICRPDLTGCRKCVPICVYEKCGPHAICVGIRHKAHCSCEPGFEGDPYNPTVGCKILAPVIEGCQLDDDCTQSEICVRGHKCVPACDRRQCGPNAVCHAFNHRAQCACLEGFKGDPDNPINGCRRKDECTADEDCYAKHDVCRADNTGERRCVHACRYNKCGFNTRCVAGEHNYHCECVEGHVRDPGNLFACVPRAIDECRNHTMCPSTAQCIPNSLGVFRCAEVCISFSCTPDADCIPLNHMGRCRCREGFTGDPNSREGCRTIPEPECIAHSDCSLPTQVCQFDEHYGERRCQDGCRFVKCGPRAICVVDNHLPKCACPHGNYIGDPYDQRDGCRQVECLKDEDCHPKKACFPNFYCEDPCVDGCGINAACVAQNHQRICHCRPGYTGDPLVRCEEIHFCDSNPCHLSGKCVDTPGGYECVCQNGFIGDPYRQGCRHPNSCPNGNGDCPGHLACFPDHKGSPMCQNPCDHFSCGPNTQCRPDNKHGAVCECLSHFRGDPAAGCVRESFGCLHDADCAGGYVCLDAQCRLACSRENDCAVGEKCVGSRCVHMCYSNNDCPPKEACLSNGYCQIGCRTNADCPSEETCSQNRCQNPCLIRGLCGPNAICTVRNHEAYCSCADGLVGNPTPQIGCTRAVLTCTGRGRGDCPSGLSCFENRCRATCSGCIVGEACVRDFCMSSCAGDSECPAGELCIHGHCQFGCRTDNDCQVHQVCSLNTCHCKPGFKETPYGCEDINECIVDHPCHKSAICHNTLGSFLCKCPEGFIGDGFTGCSNPGECPRGDVDCPQHAACDRSGITRCIDPCANNPCGPYAICSVLNHRRQCHCPKTGLFTGDPYDKNRGCIAVDCLADTDCHLSEHCVNFVCQSPCDNVNCGPHGTCVVRNRQSSCECDRGYENKGLLHCVDVDECAGHPCHYTALCDNTSGGYTCRCPAHLVGDPFAKPGQPGCHDPNICFNGNSDCPSTSACLDVKGTPYCKDPCEVSNPCGSNSKCTCINHQPVCSCAPGFTGNPKVRCEVVECIADGDCRDSEICALNKCVDACRSNGNCGINTICESKLHSALCRCKDGFRGNPSSGCIKNIPCDYDDNCPIGEFCYRGLCRLYCKANRECGSNEICEDGRCREVCRANSDCPEGFRCVLGNCEPADRCFHDGECGEQRICRSSHRGYDACIDPCETTLCGRNAVCIPNKHSAICKCLEGYVGDPLDGRVGCKKAECFHHEDCRDDQICHENKCIDLCVIRQGCGPNAHCISKHHSATCTCREGYEGDPVIGCVLIDFCRKSNPCHRTALCRNRFGGAQCECPPDRHIGNPNGPPGCRHPNECPNGDVDCPPTAACIHDGSVPMCKSPCSIVGTCGPDAICRVDNHKASCYCPHGFTGQPYDRATGCVRIPPFCDDDTSCPAPLVCEKRRCRPPCSGKDDCATREICVHGHCIQGCLEDHDCLDKEICLEKNCVVGCRADSDCRYDETCILNQCKNPCANPTACGTNAECQTIQHRVQCTCPPRFTGDALVSCVRVSVACRTAVECGDQYSCVATRCRVDCSTDADCAFGERCFSNSCYILCRSDSECHDGEICVGNRCQLGCRSNEQCPDHLACVSNQCRDPCEGQATCGPNAECRVANHRPVCSCPSHFVGRPHANVACVRRAIICSASQTCEPGSVCFLGYCRLTCSTNQDCALNERCVDNRCHVQCHRDKECFDWEICEHNFCKVGCRADTDCPSHLACIKNQCTDPCASPAACGTNAVCVVHNHRPQCSCPAGLRGEAEIECVRTAVDCRTNDECGVGQRCESTICRVSCSSDNECFDNERCVERYCSLICTADTVCPKNHICEKGLCFLGCRSDYDCPSSEQCLNRQCVNPCESPTACGPHAKCQPTSHRALCSCLPGFTGDPQVECNKVECVIDSECSLGKICQNYRCYEGCRSDATCRDDQSCISRQCQNPCTFMGACGANAICVTKNHQLTCSCPPKTIGDPFVECINDPDVCTRSSECGPERSCDSGRCVLIVECHRDPDCQLGHICESHRCFEGCRSDSNCPVNQACHNGQCRNPCTIRGACGVHADCLPERHQAHCFCPPGLTGNPQFECKRSQDCRVSEECQPGFVCLRGQCAPAEFCASDNDCNRGEICENTRCIVGCRSNSDCDFFLECRERVCKDPCVTGACGINARCQALGHHAECRCPQNYEGDPRVHCKEIQVECHTDNDCGLEKYCVSTRCIFGCRVDEHCPFDKACIQGQCNNPCSQIGACGINALCRPHHHRAVCTCPHDKVGDPRVQCTTKIVVHEIRTECSTDHPCTAGFICRNHHCIPDGCSHDSACNPGEICERRKCIPGCRRDSDCTFDKACINARCIDPCSVQNACGINAHCRPVVHRPVCSCVPAFEGNPYDRCSKPEIRLPPPECTRDPDCTLGKICELQHCIEGCRSDDNCPFDRACYSRICQNPCLQPHACGKGAKCLPASHRPVCTCSAGLTGDPAFECTVPTQEFCFHDADCPLGRICEKGFCVDACRTDDACPFDQACIRNRCQNPCSFEYVCGLNADCKAANHKAVCLCTPGLTGNPLEQCVEVREAGCYHDRECPFGQICITKDCIEGCRTDDHCSPLEACYRGKCTNLCKLPGTCGTGATCVMEAHRPVCSCEPGYIGDPRFECRLSPPEQPKECEIDSECQLRHICESHKCVFGCRSDQRCGLEEACVNGICQNPCSVFGACGRNALCTPINHHADCTCLPGHRGNPAVVCVKDEPKPECTRDIECPLGFICDNQRCIEGCRHDNNCANDRACMNGQCELVCRLPNACGINALCQARNHHAICSCLPGFQGDARTECKELREPGHCIHDSDCAVGLICETAVCVPGCRTDHHCGFLQACIRQTCQDPCKQYGACGLNAVCRAWNHDRICSCLPDHTGDPKQHCVKVLPPPPECVHDTECHYGRICELNKCIVGCRSDVNCPIDNQCLNRQCKNPCLRSGVCGRNAICNAVQHRELCTCDPGYTGDPEIACEKVPDGFCRRDEECGFGEICHASRCIPGCRSHSQCPFNKACINRLCQDPCLIGGVCGTNTKCHAANHEAICNCLPGYTGDPLTRCELVPKPECYHDLDCGEGYVCVDGRCKDINECLHGRGPCGHGAICNNLPGSYQCTCPSGLIGDPYYERCRQRVEGCTRDDDCKNYEACDRITEQCYDVCHKPGVCGRGAECLGLHHRPECTCPSGLRGNPHVECSVARGCVHHHECPGNLQCLGEYCGCPRPFQQRGFFCILTSHNCTTTNPCSENQECIYDGPAHTGFCVCPRGFVLMPNGVCRDINECDQVPFPCATGAQCYNKIGSFECVCPTGTSGEPYQAGCEPPKGECTTDHDCSDHKTCNVSILKCYDPCLVPDACGHNARCRAIHHKAQCECPAGHTGNPKIQCYKLIGCPHEFQCPGNLLCLDGYCGCPPDFKHRLDYCFRTSHNCTTTNPCDRHNEECVYVGRKDGFCVCPRGFRITPNDDCVDINECVEITPCGQAADCVNLPGSYECACPPEHEGDPYKGACLRIEPPKPRCITDDDCPLHEACDRSIPDCRDPCLDAPCGIDASCRVQSHRHSCTCPPGYTGDPLVRCVKIEICGIDYNCPGNLICLDDHTCGCPPNLERRGDFCIAESRNCTTTNPCQKNEDCIYVGPKDGFCVCPRGFRHNPDLTCTDINECIELADPCARNALCINTQGGYECNCPPGTVGDPYIRGCEKLEEGCKSNEDCPNDKICDNGTKQCISPCFICGPSAICTVTNHVALCTCPSELIGDPYDKVHGCYVPPPPKTEPPIQDTPPGGLDVMCLADGVQVLISLDNFNGVVYVKGHSQDENCRRIIANSNSRETIDFKVLFNTCGLVHINGEASFVLVIQKHPKLVTYRARAYHIKCVYNTGERTVTLGFNVSMITTSGTIANTGPPPTCQMQICTIDGKEVSQAEIGDDLLLKVTVQPYEIYGGFARGCIAKTMEDDEEVQYEVTDNNGCATDTSIFDNWSYEPESKVLMARFNAFKFPSSNNLRFQCSIRVCFGSCPPVHCQGVDAFGRRRRRRRQVGVAGGSDLNPGSIGFQEGQLREEIQVQSNAILTFEKKENQIGPLQELNESPAIEEIDTVCLPKLGLIISLIITTLLALVAVAVAISCWLMAYRRRARAPGPLPHPAEFPNPLYTTPEPTIAEPAPDYYQSPPSRLSVNSRIR